MKSRSLCFSGGISFTKSDQGTSRPSTSDWNMPNTSEPHCGSYVHSEPGACNTPGGISQPVPRFSRYARDKSRIPLSPLLQSSRHLRTWDLVVPGSKPINVYAKLLSTLLS